MRDNWSEKLLGECCIIKGRIGFRGYTVEDIVGEDEGAISLSPSNIKNSKLSYENSTYISWFKYDESPEIKLEENDILLVKTGSTYGKTAQVKNLTKPATINPQIVVLKKITEDSVFLGYLMQNSIIQKQIEATVVGGAIPTLSQENISNFKIHLPPLLQQQKIARILSTCDEVLEKTEAAISKYQAIKQGMMHDLFTRGIDIKTGKLRPKYEDAPELYQESELGWIPREWEVKRLEEFLLLKSGDGITSKNISESDDYPVYGGNGLRGYTNKYTHEGDYVLIGRQGALCGNITLANGKFYASEHAVVVTILNDSHVKWIEHKLYSMNLNQYSEASAQPGLSVNKIVKLSIAVPSGMEQLEIAKRLIALEEKIRSEQSTLSKYQQIKAGLMQDLLSGKVEVV